MRMKDANKIYRFIDYICFHNFELKMEEIQACLTNKIFWVDRCPFYICTCTCYDNQLFCVFMFMSAVLCVMLERVRQFEKVSSASRETLGHRGGRTL